MGKIIRFKSNNKKVEQFQEESQLESDFFDSYQKEIRNRRIKFAIGLVLGCGVLAGLGFLLTLIDPFIKSIVGV